MNCNGKTYPLLSNCSFDLVLFGNQHKGKVNVKAEYEASTWKIKTMTLQTTEGAARIL